jgi:hypothetical protein
MRRRSPRRDVFGYAAWIRAAVVGAAAIGVAVVVAQYRQAPADRNAFVLYSALGYTLFCLAAVGDTLRSRIELRDDEIRVVRLVGHKSYPRPLVESVTWAKGCPVLLTLRDGTSKELPGTGHASTKVAGAIRAWLNEDRAPR